jgi:hypothetical protein
MLVGRRARDGPTFPRRHGWTLVEFITECSQKRAKDFGVLTRESHPDFEERIGTNHTVALLALLVGVERRRCEARPLVGVHLTGEWKYDGLQELKVNIWMT